jgi:hypothetical protein
MRHFSVVLILFILTACGGGGGSSSSSNKGTERNESRDSCGGGNNAIGCITPASWIVNTRLTTLPKNLKIDAIYANETRTTVVDSCVNPRALKIISSSTGSSLFFEAIHLVKGADFVLELINCKDNTLVLKSEVAKDDVREDGVGKYSVDIEALPHEELPPVNCRNSVCKNRTLYYIDSSGTRFPSEFRVLVNDQVIADTCKSKEEVSVTDLEGKRKLISAFAEGIPETTVGLNILDLGENCGQEKVFYQARSLSLTLVPLESENYEGKQTYIRLKN